MKIVLYGGGGHGKVVADIVAAQKAAACVGFIDDDPVRTGGKVGSLPVLGTIDIASRLLEEGVRHALVTIGRNDVRVTHAARLEEMGFRLATAIHPTACVAPDVVVGEGSVVMPGVIINPGTVIGRNSIINTGATVDHDCVLGDGVHIAPGVNLCGGVAVGRGTLIGVGSVVIPAIQIGDRCTIGAGSVVIQNVLSGKSVAGNPARDLRPKREK
jgi:sugar O-acyltransferase (sialic acid O-acetyltransferase NeuD family)